MREYDDQLKTQNCRDQEITMHAALQVPGKSVALTVLQEYFRTGRDQFHELISAPISGNAMRSGVGLILAGRINLRSAALQRVTLLVGS